MRLAKVWLKLILSEDELKMTRQMVAKDVVETMMIFEMLILSGVLKTATVKGVGNASSKDDWNWGNVLSWLNVQKMMHRFHLFEVKYSLQETDCIELAIKCDLWFSCPINKSSGTVYAQLVELRWFSGTWLIWLINSEAK